MVDEKRSDWTGDVGKVETPRPLGVMLAEIMAQPVKKERARSTMQSHYAEICERLHINEKPSAHVMVRNEDGTLSGDFSKADTAELEKMQRAADLLVQAFQPNSKNTLPPAKFPLSYKSTLDLAVYVVGLNATAMDNMVRIAEEQKVVNAEASAAANKSGNITKNLTLLRDAIGALTAENAGGLSKAEREKSIGIVARSHEILQTLIDDFGRDESEEHDKGTRQRLAIRDSLQELQAALRPVIAKANGEARNYEK